jgi:hypothetical protein
VLQAAAQIVLSPARIQRELATTYADRLWGYIELD